jgi:Tol biopolymer transport system component
LDWSPDGKAIAFAGDSGIYLLSLDTFKAHRLTQSPTSSEDWGPTFSPDGARLLFVRSPESGFPNEIMAVSVSGGEPIQITTDNRILGPPQWSYDGSSIIFASYRGSHPALWRVSADGKDSAVEINDSGWYPSVSHRGFRLAYQRVTRSLSIWQIDFSGPAKEKLHVLLPSTSETDQGPGPQFSPDGKKLAYMSDRSGTMEIWVSDRDGSNSYQLTAVGNAGTPRWSPDSQSIVFDAGRENKGTTIYTVNVRGGAAHPLIPGGSEDVCPSWSQDGKWIYFASHRSGEWQVWKVSSEGGMPAQVTIQGGHAPLMSLDGKYVFYAKTAFANPEIWQIPTQGGVERLVSPLVRPATWASWSVVQGGILFAGPSGSGSPTINFFDFAQHQVSTLASLNIVPFWFASTRDGNTVVFDQPGMQQAQIMLVENFR